MIYDFRFTVYDVKSPDKSKIVIRKPKIASAFLCQQILRQLIKFNNKLGVVITGSGAVKAGVYFAYIAFFVDDDRSGETFKVGQLGQAFQRVAFGWGVAGYQLRVRYVKMVF